MSLTIALVTVTSFFEVFAGLLPKTTIASLVAHIPFHAMSMGWVLPTLIGLAIAFVLPDKVKGEAFDLSQFEDQA